MNTANNVHYAFRLARITRDHTNCHGVNLIGGPHGIAPYGESDPAWSTSEVRYLRQRATGPALPEMPTISLRVKPTNIKKQQ